MRYVVGIDISKVSFDVAIVDEAGKLHARSKQTMDRQGFDAFLETLKPYQSGTLHIVMESTGIYHLPLLHYLVERGLVCHVVNPVRIKHHIQSSTLRKSKTDTKDAEAIAHFGRLHASTLPVVHATHLASLRPLLREREALTQEIASLKTDIKGLVDRLFPELSKNTNVFTRSILYLLLQAPSRKRIRNLKEKKIARILQEASGNKATLSAKEILGWAKGSIGINDTGLETVLQSKIWRLLHTMRECEAIEAAIEEALRDSDLHEDIDTLTSIPGIGKTTATHFVGEIGDIRRFALVKQLCAYIGFDPAIRQSSSSILSRGLITKRGNRSLRRTLWQMALGVIRHTDKFKAYYEKKRSEGKAFKQAVVAVANKLLRTLFTLLKNKTPFNHSLVSGSGTA
ncbi:IS110 family RNA-guided transposase [Hydrogenimonas sp.]